MEKNNHLKNWDASYHRRDNFLFSPHEEVIRFFAKYIRKQTGLSEFLDLCPFNPVPRILDLGCGIGRHVIYSARMGLEAYGIDLSAEAIQVALKWAEKEDLRHSAERIKRGNIQELPWQDGHFNFIMSHGVLDSVPFETARVGIKECARVLVDEGLFYCDLISGDGFHQDREFDGEEVVTSQHERGTIQSFFNVRKINDLICDYFEMIDRTLIRRENTISGSFSSRYHLVLKNKKRSPQ